MLNRFAKILLVGTSIAPVLGAYGLLSFLEGKPWYQAAQWFLYAGLLPPLCWLVVRFASKYGERQTVKLQSVNSADHEVLGFLLTYLLPIVAQDSIGIKNPILGLYVFGVIFWAVYNSNAFFFNPLLGLMGYHFYEIDMGNGVPAMLLARRTIRSVQSEMQIVHLFEHTYAEVGG